MPQSNGDRKYTRKDAENYVRKLGVWRFANPTDAVTRRDPKVHKELLLKLIEANKSRNDAEGKWESQAALAELKALGQ